MSGTASRWRAAVDAARLYALVGLGSMIGGVLRALVLLASSFLLVSRVGMELMPPSDEGRLSVSVELPLGTPLSRTKQIMLLAEERVRERVAPEELQHVITNAGPESWWRPGGGHEGKIELVLVPLTARARSSTEIEQEVHRALADLPGAKVQVRQTSSNVLKAAEAGWEVANSPVAEAAIAHAARIP